MKNICPQNLLVPFVCELTEKNTAIKWYYVQTITFINLKCTISLTKHSLFVHRLLLGHHRTVSGHTPTQDHSTVVVVTCHTDPYALCVSSSPLPLVLEQFSDSSVLPLALPFDHHLHAVNLYMYKSVGNNNKTIKSLASIIFQKNTEFDVNSETYLQA